MILLTGATGKIGRVVLGLLVEQGIAVRAVTRNPRSAALPDGVEVVAHDAIGAAMDGVTSVFLNARAVGTGAVDLLADARRHGVQRVVGLAAINVDDDPDLQPSRFNGDRNREVEEAVVGSGLEWVSLRPTVFADNHIGMWAAQIRAGDVVRGPFAASASAPLHEHDLAAVAVHALLSDDLLGRRPELTGPESLTFADLVTIIGDVLGRPLRYEEVPADAAVAAMIQRGVDPAFARGLMAYQARGVGRPAVVTAEVDKALGRPARTFAEWATDNVEAFR